MIFDSLIPVPHTNLRIASGKITNYVEFALEHFKDITKPPLVLHTFPLENPPEAGPSTSTPALATLPVPAPSQHDPNRKHPPCPTSQDLSKLISIIEIIKRSYAPTPTVAESVEGSKDDTANIKTKRSRKGKGKLVEGLHQYTRLGCLEEFKKSQPTEKDDLSSQEAEVLAQNEIERQEEVVLNWIETGGGTSKRPRRHHSPYLLIVLSLHSLPAFDRDSKWTHQLEERRRVEKPVEIVAQILEAGVEVEVLPAATAESTESKRSTEMELDSVVEETEGPEKKKRKRRKQRSKKNSSIILAEQVQA